MCKNIFIYMLTLIIIFWLHKSESYGKIILY